MKSDSERVAISLRNNPQADVYRVSKNLKIPIARARVFMNGIKPDEKKPTTVFGKALSEFQQAYDKDYIVPRLVRQGLRDLKKGWDYEPDFARAIGVRLADLGNYRDMFADHIVTLRSVSKRVWVGQVEIAKQMREMV